MLRAEVGPGIAAPGALALAVTSSTAQVGVGLGPLAGPPTALAEIATDRRHAEELTPLLAAVLADAGVEPGDLEMLVVDVGPGRFTGLRVGLATVRAIALATGLPVVCLTSLEILAGAEPARPVVAVVDARRGEVFQQRFDASGPDGGARVGPPADLAPAAHGVTVVGDGADRYADLYGPGTVPGRQPSPTAMLELAAGRPAVNGIEVEPLYLREPDIDRNVRAKLEQR